MAGRMIGARRALLTLLSGLSLNGRRLTGSTTFASPVALTAAANTLDVKPLGSTTTYTMSGVISGAGSLSVNANITLTAAATYTGATTVSAGRNLTLTDNYASSGFTLSTGATLTFNPSIATQVSNTNTSLNGAGTVVKSGANTWNPCSTAKSMTYAMTGGLMDIQGGTFVASSSFLANYTSNKSSLNIAASATVGGYETVIIADALTGSGALQLGYTTSGGITVGVNNTAAGTYNSAGTATFTGSISPLAGVTTGSIFTKNGTGTQILLGTNSYKGATTVNAGTLQFGNATTPASLGTGAISIASGATLALWQYNLAQTGLSVTNTITGAGALTLNGPGGSNGSFSALTGATAFTGPLTLKGARLSTNSGFGTGANLITVNSGSNIYLYGGTLANPLAIAGTGGDTYGAVRMDTGSLSGAITLTADTKIGQQAVSSASISGTITGAFTLTLAPATGGTFNLTGNSSAITSAVAASGDVMVTGNGPDTSVTSGAAIGGGLATTGSVKALTFSAVGSILRVKPISATSLSMLTATSVVNVSGFTVAFAAGFTVAAGAYNILKITSAASPTIGTITTGLANIGRTGATYGITGSAGAWYLTVTLT
jgi:autotransporter-associated beta strand protein